MLVRLKYIVIPLVGLVDLSLLSLFIVLVCLFMCDGCSIELMSMVSQLTGFFPEKA